jgi:hypothetical protein
MESEAAYFTKLTALCVAASALVKWGELQVFPHSWPPLPRAPPRPSPATLVPMRDVMMLPNWLQHIQICTHAATWHVARVQLDFPFEPTYTAAFALIGIPTVLNVLTWVQRSQSGDDNFNEFY